MPANVIEIPASPHFSFAECHWFLHRNFDDCMQKVGADHIIKAVNINEAKVLLRITESRNGLRVKILNGKADKGSIIEYISSWFDLERDLLPFYQLLGKNKVLSYMAKDFRGLRLLAIPDLFESLCWSIIGQQINLPFAYKIKRRLVEKYGEKITCEDIDYYIFPTPEQLMQADPAALRNMQLSGRKAEYLINLAVLFAKGTISKEGLAALPHFEARLKKLTEIKGIGPWTAKYALMKSLREPACTLHSDAGLLNAMVQHGLLKEKSDLPAIDRLFKKFPGWESYLVHYFWRSLAVKTEA